MINLRTNRQIKSKFNPIKLLLHQKHLLDSIDDTKYLIYICWS